MSFYHTILQEALDVFHTHGVEDITETKLIRKLNVSEATFHEFFESKDDLLQQAIAHYLASEISQHEKLTSAALNAVEELFGLLNYGVQQLRQVSANYFPELIRTQPAAWQLYLQHSESHTLPLVAKILNRGINEGLFLKGLDTALVTRLILGQINVLFDQTLFPAGEYPVSTVYRSVYMFLIRGICTQKGIQLSEKIVSLPEQQAASAATSDSASVEVEAAEE